MLLHEAVSHILFIVDTCEMGICTQSIGKDMFWTTVKVYTGSDFYRWIFESNGEIRIKSPAEFQEEYGEMLKKALEFF